MFILQTVFEEIDIIDLKIYYDTEKQNYRSKSNCDMCDEFVCCLCYDTLEDAYMRQYEGMWCDKCYLKETLLDGQTQLEDILKLISRSNDPNRLEDIYNFVIGLLDNDEVREALSEVQCDCDPLNCSGEICK